MDTPVFICHTQSHSCALAILHARRLQIKFEPNPIHINLSFELIAFAWPILPRDPIAQCLNTVDINSLVLLLVSSRTDDRRSKEG